MSKLRRASADDRVVFADFGQYATDGWDVRPGTSVAVPFQAGDSIWEWILRRAQKVNRSGLSVRQIEALGYMCFGEQFEFAHECWAIGTVESLQAMLGIVHQQAIEGLLVSRKVASLMRWTRNGTPVSHKNAQQHARDALKRLDLNREELLVLLSRGILDRIQWTLRGRWRQQRARWKAEK